MPAKILAGAVARRVAQDYDLEVRGAILALPRSERTANVRRGAYAPKTLGPWNGLRNLWDVDEHDGEGARIHEVRAGEARDELDHLLAERQAANLDALSAHAVEPVEELHLWRSTSRSTPAHTHSTTGHGQGPTLSVSESMHRTSRWTEKKTSGKKKLAHASRRS